MFSSWPDNRFQLGDAPITPHRHGIAEAGQNQRINWIGYKIINEKKHNKKGKKVLDFFCNVGYK